MTENNHSARPTADSDLQRVREILFGAEQQRQTSELARIEQHFERQLAEVREQASTDRAKLAAELESTRQQLEEKIEALREGKIEKDDLADMFGGIVQRLGTAAKQLGG